MSNASILVTGAAGFIGSHLLVALSNKGRNCVPLDNFSNSNPIALSRIQSLTTPGTVAAVAEVDVRDRRALSSIISNIEIAAVVHLAGLKSVKDSISNPLEYYDNNLVGTMNLLEELSRSHVRTLVFSSSATVYDQSSSPPYREASPLGPSNPYGRTKLMVEQLLDDLVSADPTWKIVKLRYFNPVGAHPTGVIGEDPRGIPNNLMPYVCDVAARRRDQLTIFGQDYPTHDGTGIRDYIHVMDLAEGHVSALDTLEASPPGTSLTINLGTGRGTSVQELVATFERVNSVEVPRRFAARRVGDVAVSYADCTLAKELLGWEARRSLDEMCKDAWAWRIKNPRGYEP